MYRAPSVSHAAPHVGMSVTRALVALVLTLASASTATFAAGEPAAADAGARTKPLCLYVSSYHVGYRWSDGLERGLREAIGDACTIEQFDMDTKRRRGTEAAEAAAAEAWALIERLEPDIVITSDDNAAKHLVVPHLLDGPVPVVFSGVNWTVEEYGFPTDNVTGIVEIAPIRPMFREALTLAPGSTRAIYIGARTPTEVKNYARMSDTAWNFGVMLDSVYAETLDAWKSAFDYAQSYDFVIIGSYSGIDDWDDDEASAHALAHARRPSLTSHDWMMPVSLVGYTKLAEEHGERAGVTALAILDGTDVRDIPIVTNRKWDTWLNVALSARLNIPIPERLVRRAKEIGR